MQFNEYQDKVEGFMNPSTLETFEGRLLNATLGLAGETGEVCDSIKKWAFHGHELDMDALKKEVGDILFYVAETASAIGITLEDAAIMNVEKLTKRYPNGFNVEDSKAKKDEYEGNINN